MSQGEVGKEDLVWVTVGIIAPNDGKRGLPINSVVNCLVRLREPNTKRNIEGYVMLTDLRDLINKGSYYNPMTQQHERFVRIKVRVSRQMLSEQKEALIKPKRDLLSKVVGGI
jgi:hypothetical protein